MKRALDLILSIKNGAAMAFVGMLMLYVVIGWFFGLHSISFALIWQFLFIALITGTMQFICFTEHVVKTMRYPLRLLLFALPLYLCISAFAAAFRWFPLTLTSWLLFTAIFLVAFAIITAVFEAYFRITGRRYTQMLDAFKERQGR